MKRFFIAILLMTLGATSTLGAEATLEKISKEGVPIEIDSDSMELRSRDNLVIFTGSVSAVRGDMTIQSDRLEVYTAAEGEDIDKIIALGKVRVKRGTTLASGEKGVFLLSEETVTLTGDPKIWDGRNAVAGKVIKFFLAEERYVIEEGVHGQFYPKKEKE